MGENSNRLKWSQRMAARTVEIDDETHIVVPRILPPHAKRAARLAMPIEFEYWTEGGRLHAKFRSEKERVDPQTVWHAAIQAIDADAAVKD